MIPDFDGDLDFGANDSVDTKLNVEFKFNDVAVLHNVGFTLSSEFAGGFDGLLGAEFF